MIDQLVPPAEFDDWAASYDQTTQANSGFPFDGYNRVLQTIVDLATAPRGLFNKWVWELVDSPIGESTNSQNSLYSPCQAGPGCSVLDLGIGTGNLALPFVQRGVAIWGLDFSANMLALAQAKLPQATLGQVDLRAAWPPAFRRRFDCIVSGYTFHHFRLEEKIGLVQRLLKDHLAPDGRLVIGDIAFQDAAEEDRLRQALGPEWEQEYFWLADETLAACAVAGISARFLQVSTCAGVFGFQHH